MLFSGSQVAIAIASHSKKRNGLKVSVATRPKAASTVDASIHQRRPGAMNLLQSRDALATPLEDIHGISIA
jgi:hypothetical protein